MSNRTLRDVLIEQGVLVPHEGPCEVTPIELRGRPILRLDGAGRAAARRELAGPSVRMRHHGEHAVEKMNRGGRRW